MILAQVPVGPDEKVNDALTAIEADLRVAFIAAIGRINVLLADNPTDTKILHCHDADLHNVVQIIDGNKQRRARRR